MRVLTWRPSKETSERNTGITWRRFAVVGGSFMINLQIRLGAALLGGEVQTFASEELEEAWDWVRE